MFLSYPMFQVSQNGKVAAISAATEEPLWQNVPACLWYEHILKYKMRTIQ